VKFFFRSLRDVTTGNFGPSWSAPDGGSVTTEFAGVSNEFQMSKSKQQKHAKRMSELTPEEQEERRAYNRSAKQKSREKQKTAQILTADEWWDQFWASEDWARMRIGVAVFLDGEVHMNEQQKRKHKSSESCIWAVSCLMRA
jgi:hypothetical protein